MISKRTKYAFESDFVYLIFGEVIIFLRLFSGLAKLRSNYQRTPVQRLLSPFNQYRRSSRAYFLSLDTGKLKCGESGNLKKNYD